MRSNRPRSWSTSETTSSAPSWRSPAARAELLLTIAVTSAPPRWASWIANRPTPPVAPVTRTRRPRMDGPIRSMRRAARPAVGRAAPWAKETPSGSSAIQPVEPPPARPSSRLAGCRPLGLRLCGPPSTSDRRMPAKSHPGRQPSAAVRSIRISPRLIENARTSTSTSPGAATGSATSCMAILPGADPSATSARIRESLLERPGPD